MFNFLPLSLDENQAVALDNLFVLNSSIKKRGELLTTLIGKTPDEITYLVCLIMSDYLDKDVQDISSVDRLLNMIDVEVTEPLVLIPLLQSLEKTQHLYKNYNKFYKNVCMKFNKLDLDIEKVLNAYKE